MMKDKIHNNRTDKAWEKLHQRLADDKLLEDVAVGRTDVRKIQPILKWGVAAAVILVCGITLFGVLLLGDKTVDATRYITCNNAEKSSLVQTLTDGSVVYLAKAASLKYPETFDSNKREVDLHGEAFFDVAKNSRQPFFIETESVRIKVIGTAFNVKTSKETPFQLVVQRGLVCVSLKSGEQKLYVKAGQTATLFNRKLFVSLNEESDIFDRYRKNIRFKDEPLKDIVRIINMNTSQVPIKIASTDLENRKLTVAFTDLSSESSALLISAALNLTYVKQNHQLVLYDSKVK